MKSKHIVFVHGIFGWGPDELGTFSYWGLQKKKAMGDFFVHEVGCGPVSSFHDRACELAAQIKGQRVDYGKRHSEKEHHEQFSKDYTGKPIHKNWSEENPIILIAHSAGAHTCLMLQQRLEEDFWGWGSNSRWVECIVTISGVLNGSTLPYQFGCDPQTGKLVGPLGLFLGRLIEILAFTTGRSKFYDFDLGHWLSNQSFDNYHTLFTALEECHFSKGCDNLAFDLTLQGCQNANKNCSTYPDTYYLSFVTEQTKNGLPERHMTPLLIMASLYQGLFVNFDTPPITGWGSGHLSIDQWRENDGAVSSISQRFPFSAGNHPVFGEGILKRDSIQKGYWYYEKIENSIGKRLNHLDVVFGGANQPRVMESHSKFYESIIRLLSKL